MTDPLTESEPLDPNRVEQTSVHESNVAGVDALALKNQANAVLEHAAISGEYRNAPPSDHTDTVHPPLHSDVFKAHSERREQSGTSAPPKTQTQPPHEPAPLQIDTIATSPNLSKHVIPVAEGATGTLPAMHAMSPIEGTSGSPQGAKLPPLHQITGQMHDPLNVFAEVAAQQDPRGQAYAHHHSHSVGSATSQSPLATHHAYPAAQHTPPALPYAHGARSPPRAPLDQPFYGSPPQHPPSAYFAHRRPLIPSDGGAPPHPHLQPSHSSSGESLGHASASTTDGYSTARTTPPAVAQASDGPPRAVLPPPPGMGSTPGFKCDYPDCNAPPFQTQYLLRYVPSGDDPTWLTKKMAALTETCTALLATISVPMRDVHAGREAKGSSGRMR